MAAGSVPVFFRLTHVCRNENQSSGVQIALLISHMSVDGSFLDQHNLILLEVFVCLYRTSWSHISSRQHQMLRAIIFRADLEDEPAGVRLARLGTPQSLFSLVFLQQQWRCA